jgi:hypothetical protein
LARAGRILETLGVTLNREKTRIVHIAQGFGFLGFKIGRGKGRFKLTRDRIKSKLNRQNLYAIPTQKSVDRFKDQIRALTMRRIPLRLGELIETINPIIRGWGNYYCRSAELINQKRSGKAIAANPRPRGQNVVDLAKPKHRRRATSLARPLRVKRKCCSRSAESAPPRRTGRRWRKSPNKRNTGKCSHHL